MAGCSRCRSWPAGRRGVWWKPGGSEPGDAMSGPHGPGDRLQRIVLLRALGLGDFLTGIPAYRAVRRAFPDAEITLAAPAGLRPLAQLAGAAGRPAPPREHPPGPWALAPPGLAIALHGPGAPGPPP